jgi:hypothetical protein
MANIEDKIFGEDQWVYCKQHLRPHLTGWCSVGVNDKIGLGIFGKTEESMKKAYSKCINWGFKIITKDVLIKR